MTDYQEEWGELTEKEILIGILTELQQIRLQLQGTEQQTIDTYSCLRCTWEGPKEDCETHALTKHKAPPDLAMDLFEQKG